MNNTLLLPVFSVFTFVTIPSPTINYQLSTINYQLAHTVKVSGDIGGTIHIEPNDNPRAGEPAQTWFALTRKGGEVVPLSECDCNLRIYAQPYTPGEPALLEPALKPVQAERYNGIPGTEIIFPKPGLYELKLSGKPATDRSFQPFELRFEVTVAAGKKVEISPEIANVNQNNQQQNLTVNNQEQNAVVEFAQPLIIGAISLLSLGIVFFLIKALKKGNS
jgi:hypothetical protein